MLTVLKIAFKKMIPRRKTIKLTVKVDPDSIDMKEKKRSTSKSVSHSCYHEREPSSSKTIDCRILQEQKKENYQCEKKRSTISEAVLDCGYDCIPPTSDHCTQTLQMENHQQPPVTMVMHSTKSVYHIVREVMISSDNMMLIYIMVLLAVCTLIGALSLVIQLSK